MSKREACCKCPPHVRQFCKHAKRVEHIDVKEVIEALNYEEMQRKDNKPRKLTVPTKFKTKPFKPRHYKDTCVPMRPSMHTRLRYISHCPIEPTNETTKKLYASRDFQSSSDEGTEATEGSGKFKKKVRYYDLQPGDVHLKTPSPVVKHTDSDKFIVKLASPKISGEVISAQTADVKPSQWKPPLPGKSGHDLFKPHSGIVLNQDKTFVPDVVDMPGKLQKSHVCKPCHKPMICKNKKCPRKKCREYHARRQRMARIRMRRGGSGKLGATDGKPRMRGSRSRPRDDDSNCGVDEIPHPEHAFIPANLKKGMLETHSLTVLPCGKDKTAIHYGILTGTFNMYNSKFGPKSRGRQALTMSVMAYCLAFHYHPKQWTMKLIDNLVDSGDTWYLQCLEKVHDHTDVQGICEVLPYGKKQTLVLNKKRMQVLLGEPDIIGYTMSTDPTVYNLCRGLVAFFKDHRAGILLTRVMKVVIWKDRVCYYIFDPAGRDARATSNFTDGSAALINVANVKAVAQVLLSRSIVEDQKFVLASLKVLRMVKETADDDFESEPELTAAEKERLSYRIINENCAIVNANMHVGDRIFEEGKYRQAIPVAVVAMTYAKISPPNTWYSKTLDKILRLGHKLYQDCIQPKVLIDLTIDNIPNEIALGPYACEIIIYRERVNGQLFTPKECIFNIKTGLAEFFSHEYNSGILEFNNYSMAVWRQKEMYYLFDPYPRATDGSRSFKSGRACCWMLLNPESIATVFIKNWDYMPATTQFHIHAFKVLKLKKRLPKTAIVCTLSDDNVRCKKKAKRSVLHAAKSRGDTREPCHDVLASTKSSTTFKDIHKSAEAKMDEEQMGDIVSLVDSIQGDYVPPIPRKFKNLPYEDEPERVVNLDSPTVSVTQVVPPWPRPRDKSHELPEPDPSPEPTPPPTPPPPPIPEGGVEEEEEKVEEEEDEETRQARLEELARKKAEEEEARRKAEELPPPLSPPPPSPQPEREEELAPLELPCYEPAEMETVNPPPNVRRKVLLTEDAKRRFKLRQLRKNAAPLGEPCTPCLAVSLSEELRKPSNFKALPDGTEIIKASSGTNDRDVLPFSAIMAIVTSYKYNVNTWTKGIVDFVVNGGKQLHSSKKERFQTAPVHIIPKIGIGKLAYHANIDVVGEGATWEMENIVINKFLPKHDRGIITTSTYSCAFFKKNGLYYLFDGSSCNPMGLRDDSDKGNACLLRFRKPHDLIARIMYNKDGPTEDQQFILSRILVRQLLTQPRYKLPDDYDYDKMAPKNTKSKSTLVPESKKTEKKTEAIVEEPKSKTKLGYTMCDGIYRIEGTTALQDRSGSSNIKSCHFVSLMAMLMATMHPLKSWDHTKVDTCIEKGLEIHKKAVNLSPCEKRVIKNVLVDGKFVNINIKRILVINNNQVKKVEQYIKAVARRLRFFLIRYPQCSMVVTHSDGYYHIFDPYASPVEPYPETAEQSKFQKRKCGPYASWTLYGSQEALINRLRKTIAGSTVETPEFYTFELTSIRTAPRHSGLDYRLSPLFKPEENPNSPYIQHRRQRPMVDEKMYWLDVETIPWSRSTVTNDLGFPRKTPRTMWKEWEIEFPGDLYSLWGTLHPLDAQFAEKNRGKQYLATSVVAIAMTQACNLSAWTGSFLDGIVKIGDDYHQKSTSKFGNKENHEMNVEDLDGSYNQMYPYSFNVKFHNIIFGFVYNMLPDRFNLSKALDYFFETHNLGLLVSPTKNLAFGRAGKSYFMFDCQSFGSPVFCPGQGSAYMLKCESLNRLVYCITLTLNIKRHGTQFHLYSVDVNLAEIKK